MPYKTIVVKDDIQSISVKINRMDNQNSISLLLLKELHTALDLIEKQVECRIIVLEGHEELFCSGMDFQEILSLKPTEIHNWASLYSSLLRKLSTISKITIAKLDGKVIAGGTGLVAACDYVVSTHRTTFKLTEALWGLLPAMVSPYLIRRIGLQKTYAITLTAQTLSAADACTINLIDSLNDDLEGTIEQLLNRFNRLDLKTISEIKLYFQKFECISNSVETSAIETTTRLLQSEKVRDNISNFIHFNQLPWIKPQNTG